MNLQEKKELNWFKNRVSQLKKENTELYAQNARIILERQRLSKSNLAEENRCHEKQIEKLLEDNKSKNYIIEKLKKEKKELKWNYIYYMVLSFVSIVISFIYYYFNLF